MNRALVGVILGGTMAALVGCGDDDGAELPDEKVLSTLSSAEVGRVCDQLAQQYGGYGKTFVCSEEEEGAVWPDQEACKAAISDVLKDCGATFGQLKACTAKMAASKCDSSAAERSAECQAFEEAC